MRIQRPHRIYLRGGTYWVSATRYGRRIRQSLGTDDHDVAAERADLVINNGVANFAENHTLEIKCAARRLLKYARNNSNNMGREFTLTIESVEAMLIASQGLCSVSGAAMDFRAVAKRDPWRPSIDRIDPKKGYTPDNCRVVCFITNLAMNDFGEDALRKLAHHFVSSSRHKSRKEAA